MGFGLAELMQTQLVFPREDLESLTTFSFKILGYEVASIAEEWIKLLRLIYLKH